MSDRMQKTVYDFVQKHHLGTDEKIRYIDLVSEVGELGKEILKGCDYGKKSCEIGNAAQEEMGDCLFSILALCNEMRIDAGEALKKAMRKYEMRFMTKGEISSGR